jgi:hypothetical protein
LKTIECEECSGSGFSKAGTGYDSVCDNCGGLGKYPSDEQQVKAKAKKSDSWMGIVKDNVYDTEMISDKLWVKTDGYMVLFEDDYFSLVR